MSEEIDRIGNFEVVSYLLGDYEPRMAFTWIRFGTVVKADMRRELWFGWNLPYPLKECSWLDADYLMAITRARLSLTKLI